MRRSQARSTGRSGFFSSDHAAQARSNIVCRVELPAQTGVEVDAREHFQTLVRERPSFLDAAAMLGLACYLAGDGLAARAVWEELRARRPEDPRVEAYLALLSRSDVVPVGAAEGAGGAAKPDRRKKKK